MMSGVLNPLNLLPGHEPADVRTWRMSRISGTTPDPEVVSRRAQTFASATRDLTSSTLLLTRDERELAAYLIVDSGGSGHGSIQAAGHLAQTVGAQADPVDAPPDLSETPAISVLTARASGVATRDNQLGNPSELALRMATALRAGQWIAAVTRPASDAERKFSRRWYEHRLATQAPTHHSTAGNPLATTFYAGADTQAEANVLLDQLAAAMPGFDVDTNAGSPSNRGLIRVILAITALGGLAYMTGSVVLTVTTILSIIAMVAGVKFKVIRTAKAGILDGLTTGHFPTPARRFPAPRKPRKAVEGDKPKPAFAGDYPMSRSAFLVGPAVIAGLVSPHTGGASGATGTARREPPPALLDASIGPWIGTAGEHKSRVHLSLAAFTEGVAAIGKRGSGKSNFLRAIYAVLVADRVNPSGIPGAPGKQNALVAFESKGEGAAEYKAWSEILGDRTVLIDLADPTTFAIDIFAIPGTLQERVLYTIDAMIYAFPVGAIQGQAIESLTAILHGAFVVGSPVVQAIGLPAGVSPGKSAIHYAHVLAKGDETGVALAAAISEAAVEAEKTDAPDACDLADADRELALIYGPKVTPSQRRSQTESARRRLGQLSAPEYWWSPARKKVTWEQILTGHKSVIINTGISSTGVVVSDEVTAIMSSLLMFSLRNAMQRYCNGWAASGQYVSTFSDELSLLAGSSPEVIAWFQDKGRSYGACPFFASQRVDQLHPQVQRVIQDFSTILWMQQSNPDVAKTAARDLDPSGTDWTATDITNLEPYVAALRTTVRGIRQPSVPVTLENFEEDRTWFPQLQNIFHGLSPRTIKAPPK